MKASEVAAMFGVTRQTIRNWIKKNLLQAIEMDGAQYIHIKSLKKVESALRDIAGIESNVSHYKESLDAVEERYSESVQQLRDCCEGNQALKYNRQTIVRFLPVFYDLIKPDLTTSDRGVKILSMLLEGCDIRSIAEHFGLTVARIQQIIENELHGIRKDTENYRMLKSQRDKLMEEVKILRLNARSFESLKYDAKIMENVKPSILTKKLYEFDLSVRALNCCKFGEIENVADLVSRTKTDILKLRCMGRKTLIELDELVSSLGLEWGKKYIVQPDGTVVEASNVTI